ncbi:MAG TPA: DUF4856 domain-containing protein [Chryseosolibacter sp.]|nr:DUF4856 domain-containing protein [Chryseosolibacter sp.]
MTKHIRNPKIFLFAAVLGLFSCDDDEKQNLRPGIDYSVLTAETPYTQLFVDANGATTVDLTEGNHRFRMFQALNYQSTNSVKTGVEIEAATLKNMFKNEGNPFTDISTATVTVVGAELNGSTVQLRDVVASSRPTAEAEAVRAKIEAYFDAIDVASASLGQTASQGAAGKLGDYLVDARGIEIAQVIQKSLIGALQVDYICNVLLDEGLTADNYSTVGDKNYTQLEHNWDVAFGLLTINQVYAQGATADTKNALEFGLGSYVWEYNRANYTKIHPAFLKGRAAIVNNDRGELQTQADLLRTEFEKTLANAALAYLDKWKTGATEAARAHAIAEGLGFIYSLRFATMHNADAAFSDDVLDDLIGSANGFWDLNATKINAASDAIKAKFGL